MLEAGTRLFARSEYQAVSMDAVAAAADVSKPMVYDYFRSKQGLFLACIDHWTAELVRRLEEATPASLPPDARLWAGLLATFRFIDEEPEAWALLHPHGPEASGQLAAGAARTHEAMTRLIARLLCDAATAEGIDPDIARDATEPLAHALVAATQGIAAWGLRNPDEPKERQALRLMNFAWMGLENLLVGKLWLPPAEGVEVGAGTASATAANEPADVEQRLAEDRDALLDELFARIARRYDPGRAGDLDAVVEWRVGGRENGGHDRFQLVFGRDGCRVERDGGAAPGATFTIDAADLLRLVSGQARSAELYTFGKLRIDGDLMLAARVPGLFGTTRGRK